MGGWTVESHSLGRSVSRWSNCPHSVTRARQPPAQRSQRVCCSGDTERTAAKGAERALRAGAGGVGGEWASGSGQIFPFPRRAPFPFAGWWYLLSLESWAGRWRWPACLLGPLVAAPPLWLPFSAIHPLVFPAQNPLARGTLVPRSSRAEPLVPFSQEAISTDHHRALADPCKRNPRRIKPFLGWGATWRAWAGQGRAPGEPRGAKGKPGEARQAILGRTQHPPRATLLETRPLSPGAESIHG